MSNLSRLRVSGLSGLSGLSVSGLSDLNMSDLHGSDLSLARLSIADPAPCWSETTRSPLYRLELLTQAPCQHISNLCSPGPK